MMPILGKYNLNFPVPFKGILELSKQLFIDLKFN